MGCSKMAFCTSPTAEELLKAEFIKLSKTLSQSEVAKTHQALFDPADDMDIEVHHKEGSVLRLWSRIKWVWSPLARFIDALIDVLEEDTFLLIRLGSEEVDDNELNGNFYNNPFSLWTRRDFVFMDTANQPQISQAAKNEMCSYQACNSTPLGNLLN